MSRYLNIQMGKKSSVSLRGSRQTAMETKEIIFLKKKQKNKMRERERDFVYIYSPFSPWGNNQHLDVLSLLSIQKNHLAAEEMSSTQWRLKFQHLGIIAKMFSIIYAQEKRRKRKEKHENPMEKHFKW